VNLYGFSKKERGREREANNCKLFFGQTGVAVAFVLCLVPLSFGVRVVSSSPSEKKKDKYGR
jgi:hypothetical protein